MSPAEEVVVVLLTAPDAGIGGGLARTLVEERLAACVNVVPGVRSTYRWEGRIQEDAEVLLIAKTRADRCEALQARIRAIHPYSLPEMLVLSASGGSADYLAWVAAETRP
jgi:periplasmic divalent cation tolerance protein